MNPTVEYLEKKFCAFNDLCFDGSLPKIPIELTTSKRFLGRFMYKIRRFTHRYYDVKIKINRRLDCEESLLEDTLIHEMIHYYIFVNKIKDSSAHGRYFVDIMNSINEKYNRNITISHKSSESFAEQLAGTKKKMRVIAIVTFADSRTGLKVLPDDESKVQLFKRRLKFVTGINSVAYYHSDHIFFNRFPCSTALRFSMVNKEELEKILKESV